MGNNTRWSQSDLDKIGLEVIDSKPVRKVENSKTDFIIMVNPCSKPRMTQRDKWNPSKAALKYFAFKDLLRAERNRLGVPELPSQLKAIVFMVPMPKSWSKVKKAEMNGKLHEQRPDLDNYLKAFWDALCKEDSHIASIKGELGKYWYTEGRIILRL